MTESSLTAAMTFIEDKTIIEINKTEKNLFFKFFINMPHLVNKIIYKLNLLFLVNKDFQKK